jgi:hypothetical protein
MVLAVRVNGLWGAIGISRRENLMYKEAVFRSLSDLVVDYRDSYKMCFHSLCAVYAGLPFAHGKRTDSPVKWRAIKVKILTDEHDIERLSQLEDFVCSMNDALERLRRTGSMHQKVI